MSREQSPRIKNVLIVPSLQKPLLRTYYKQAPCVAGKQECHELKSRKIMVLGPIPEF